ncbi:MAG: DEAD/DEAH box helicase [Chloroflexota bacterium]|nr:DEAD/DEAH box helicase [Chloroflexota bacterium]
MTADNVKASLPHTWPVFFARHGNFTPVQQQAIPLVLAGKHTLIIAATASGKTEAALAPLIERYLCAEQNAAARPSVLRILYICPTRALVRDLYQRLAGPLEALGVTLAIKSGDTGPVSTTHPPTVLITTPESTDSLLTRAPRLLTTVQALVLDEIHLFDNSPRGDHLRCLLRRIEIIQAYHRQQTGEQPSLQRVALSATVPDPAGVAARYLVASGQDDNPVAIVTVPGGRTIQADLYPMYGLDDLVTALALRAQGAPGGSAIRKSLIFCNTRNEVEQVAAYLRRHLPYEAAIFVHYSNLNPALRLDVEQRFAEATVAICVSSSTLELGIDIGTIDDVVLVGPPPTLSSFLQRIGRGGRRRATTPVLCLPRSALEEIRFLALLDLVQSEPHAMPHAHLYTTYHFRPSVLVQQIFSSLKQSPTGAIRLADLQRIAPEPIAPEPIVEEDLRRILNHLSVTGYLTGGRPGEWRPGPQLDDLIDEHEIYSNIGEEPLAGLIVDAYSGRTLAQTGRIRVQGETLLMGGRRLEVVWRDRYRIGVRAVQDAPVDEQLRFRSAPFAVPLAIGQAVAAHLQITPNQLCLLHDEQGAWLFHFWGDLYGDLLAGLLQAHFGRDEETALVAPRNELCLRLPAALPRLPPWNHALVQRQLRILIPRLEPFLELGRFHTLLPVELADRTVVAQCDLPRFEQLYQAATIMEPAAGLRARLLGLVG